MNTKSLESELTQYARRSPKLIRPEQKEKTDDEGKPIGKPLWKPDWNCFCCEDKGVIRYHLILKIMPDFNSWHHRQPICNRLKSCQEGMLKVFATEGDIWDTELCYQLHLLNKEYWRKWLENEYESLKKTEKMIQLIDDFCASF